MNDSQTQSTLLVKKEVKKSDLGGCKDSHDFAEFGKAMGGHVIERKDMVLVETKGKSLMFSNKREPFRIEYRKLLMRAFIALFFVLVLLFAFGVL